MRRAVLPALLLLSFGIAVASEPQMRDAHEPIVPAQGLAFDGADDVVQASFSWSHRVQPIEILTPPGPEVFRYLEGTGRPIAQPLGRSRQCALL